MGVGELYRCQSVRLWMYNGPMTPDLRYPIGEFKPSSTITPDLRNEAIGAIAALPALMREAVRGLSEPQLDTPYRPGGWTVRQVVHHVPDSHLNAYIRLKLALTEDNPTIKPYSEDAWAKLPDVARAPIATSLTLLDALHERWVLLLETMTPQDFARTFVHPDRGAMTLDQLLQLYAWHGPHHVAHITTLRDRERW